MKPETPFRIKGRAIASGDIEIHIMGAGDELESITQLITIALNAHYFPQSNILESLLGSMPEEVRNSPEVQNVLDQTKKMQELLNQK